MKSSATVYAPATIANLGSGFDSIAVAITNLGDRVTVTSQEENSIIINSILGAKNLTKDPHQNTAGIAAIQVLRNLESKGVSTEGLRIDIEKGIPLQSGLGSSAASAVAAAVAVNSIYDNILTQKELIQCCLYAENTVSGRHFDNIIASFLGGFSLVENFEQPTGVRINTRLTPHFCIIKPNIRYTTRIARAILPEKIDFEKFVIQLNQCSQLIAGLCQSDEILFRNAISGDFITQLRGTLIPGFDSISKILTQEFLPFSICGSGPSIFFLVNPHQDAEYIAQLCKNVWRQIGIQSDYWICGVEEIGALNNVTVNERIIQISKRRSL